MEWTILNQDDFHVYRLSRTKTLKCKMIFKIKYIVNSALVIVLFYSKILIEETSLDALDLQVSRQVHMQDVFNKDERETNVGLPNGFVMPNYSKRNCSTKNVRFFFLNNDILP